MIPILYSATETAFTSNGLGRLRDCIECKVTEERNGKFECEFKYPITGRRYKDIQDGCFIGATHDDSGDRQPFRIYRRSAPIDGIVTFNAHHISYALNHVILNPFSASSAAETMARIVPNSINSNPFEFWTNKATTASFNLTEPASVRSILGGVEGSILDAFGGGEYEFDMYTVKLYQHRGLDTDVTIRYGKNLSDITQTVDHSNVYNAIVPFWADSENGVLVLLDERIVKAEGVTNPEPVIMDMSDEWEEAPTQAQLRAKAQAFLQNNQPWIPKTNIEIDFVQLWQTLQYKDVANLQRVRLCDTVNVYYPALGVTAEKIKVVKTVYNVLANRYDSMELGDPRTNFADQIKADYEKRIAKTVISMQGFVDAAVTDATTRITGGQGGNVVYGFNAQGKPEEILILDTDSLATATNIIRINLAGIGFSTDGGKTYKTAWTIDGRFVADYITAGTLNANIIRAGILTDAKGTNYWNLETGEFRLSPSTKIGSTGTIDDLASKNNTIIGVDVEYASGDSEDTAPTEGWSTDSPTWESGKFIWTRTKVTDGNGHISYSEPTCIQGARGEDGTSVTILGSYATYEELVAAHPTGGEGDAYLVNGDLYVWVDDHWFNVGTIQGPQGVPGENGVGITSVEVRYGTSSSASTQPSSWQTTAPTSLSRGTWLWVRTITEYSDGKSNTVYQKSYIGTDGTDGTSVFVRSATKVDGVTTVVIEDTEGHVNTLTIDDGTDGTNGTPGKNGLNGYVHVAWATSADGSQGFSTTVSAGKTYLGTYTDNTQADSQDYKSYSWSLIKGANGTDGKDGTGISSIVEQYYLSTSETQQTGGSWSETQPTWESGKYIWTRSQVAWTDGTITTTTPTLAQAINSANQNASDAEQAVSDLDNSLDQSEIFNRLTNNGETQGIFLKDGLLYINASYIQGGTLKLGGRNNGNGVLEVYDANDNKIGSWTKDGADIMGTIQSYVSFGYPAVNYPVATINQNGVYVRGYLYVPSDKPDVHIDMRAKLMGGMGVKSNEDGTGKMVGISTSEIIIKDNSDAMDGKISLTYPCVRLGTLGLHMYGSSVTDLKTYITNEGNLGLQGTARVVNLSVTGTKKRVVDTPNYNTRALYCYETPTPYFGDIGEATLDAAGVCYVDLDDIFGETIDTKIEYQVFLQKEGPGDCYVSKKAGNYFVIEGTPNLKVAWEVKAKQRDYTMTRLEEEWDGFEERAEVNEFELYESYIKEQEEILNEAVV